MKTAVNKESVVFPFQIDEFYLDLQHDGRNISILSQEEIMRKPFPGLRPFKTSEFQLFNGRVGQSEELIKRLKKNRFLAVIGSSGTGKSSLVRAGLIPQLFGGYLHEAGSNWNIAICRPGKDPVENLAIALSNIKAINKDKKELLENFNKIEPKLNNSIYGLLDVKEMLDANDINPKTDESPSNLLIIIDQFEELFRFNRKDLGKDNIENIFVNLLLKASIDPSNSVYVIITMRSEFLGDCVKYRGLPEAINEGQYLVPQLTRNELKEVIENPIKLAGKKISPNLVELLVNEIEESKLKENLDQLPILQHALMRTYNEAMLQGSETEIIYEHYKKIGEMDHALANHAEAKFKELGNTGDDEKNLSQKQLIAKIIFQTLTVLSSDQKGGRRPTELKNIYAIAASVNADEKEVNEVVNHFRDNDTSFIMPPINTELNPELILDISHESLMRNWTRLNEWLTEEMKFGNLYKQLNERRELHVHDNEEWLRGILLRELLDWRGSYANNSTWASRYHQLPKKMNAPALHESLYKKNLTFLDDSNTENERIKEEEKRELQEKIAREQKIQSAKTRARILSIAAVISLLFGLWAYAERNNARHQEEFANVQKEMAEQNANAAKLLKNLAEANAAEAKRNADSATAQRAIAEEQRKLAEQKSELAYRQGLELKRYADMARIQTVEAVQLKDSAVRKNADFEKQLVKNALKNESFYFSGSLDQATKEEIIDSLFNTPSFDTRQIQLGKYIDLNVLKLINEAVKAKENAIEDRTSSLNKAQEIWKVSQHPILKKILLSIVNDNIFSRETAKVTSNINLSKTDLAVSRNGTGFAFNKDIQVVTGKIENSKLLINENSFDVPFTRFFCSIKDSFYANKSIDWLSYNDNNNTIALIDSFVIKLGADGNIGSIVAIPGLPNYVSAQLSPDGQLVLLLNGDGNLSLKSTVNSNEKIDTIVGNYRNKLSGNENMFFSPNSQYIFLNVEGKPRIINKKTKIIGMPDWSTETIATLAFTPDSRQIIVLADGKMSVRDSSLSNKNAGYQEIDLTAKPFTQSSMIPDKINSISISQNWKKMIAGQKNGRIYLLENKKGDSLFAKNNTGDGNIRIKEIGNSRNKFKASFYNDSIIITLSDMGYVSFWNIYSDFHNPESAIAAVLPKVSFKERLEQGSVTKTEALSTDNTIELNIAADYYYSRDDIVYAQMIYEKLLDKATGNMRIYYLGKLIDMNSELNNVARIKSSLNPIKNEFNEVRAYRSPRIARLKENVLFHKERLQLCPNNIVYKQDLSTTYGSLSFNQLFENDFAGAIKSAKAGLELSPVKNDWIYTNLALGNLLSGRFKEAEKIYLEYKDKMYSDGRNSFKLGFMGDFADLEVSGVFKDLDQSILNDIEKIKAILVAASAAKKAK